MRGGLPTRRSYRRVRSPVVFVTSSDLEVRGILAIMTAAAFVDDRPLLRGWSHLIAAIAAIVLAPLLIISADGATAVAAASIYAAGVIALFVVSGTYHRVFFTTRFAKVARRLDHSMIFVFIAATYTPIAALALDGWRSTFVLWFVWIGAAAGIAINMFWLDAPSWATVAPYLVVGWCIAPFVVDVARGLGAGGFTLVLIGGLLYTAGAIVYAMRRPNPSPRWFGYHEIFHLLVIAAVATHYAAVAFVVL